MQADMPNLKALTWQAKDLVLRLSRRRKDQAQAAVYYSPTNQALRWANPMAKTRDKLELMRHEGRLIYVGHYGRPWAEPVPKGSTRMDQVAAWIVEDVLACLKE